MRLLIYRAKGQHGQMVDCSRRGPAMGWVRNHWVFKFKKDQLCLLQFTNGMGHSQKHLITGPTRPLKSQLQQVVLLEPSTIQIDKLLDNTGHQEYQERVKGLCFKCKQPYSPLHEYPSKSQGQHCWGR